MRFFKKKRDKDKFYVAYRILPKEKLIVELYEGRLTVSKVINYKLQLVEDPLYNTSYTMFGDMRECVIDAMITDVDEYIGFISKHPQLIMDKAKHVGILSTANQLMYVKGFKDKFDDEEQNQGMFVDIESGLKFINRPELQTKLEGVFKELEKELKLYK